MRQQFDWKDLVRTIAPAVGTALGTPLAGVAASAVAEAVLGDKDADEERIAEAVAKASPKELGRLRHADRQFRKDMRSLGVKTEIAPVEPGASMSAKSLGSLWPQAAISLVFILMFFVVLLLYLTGNVQVPEGNKDTVNMLLGPAIAGVSLILGFWIGSSIGSKRKEDGMLKASES